MNYRRMGDTVLTLPEIGFGCGGNAGLMVGDDAKARQEVVARAIEAGITYFDLAPDYGNGRAERALGALVGPRRSGLIINSKVEIRARDLHDIAGHIERSVAGSLERLEIDRLDIIQIHNGPVAQEPHLAGESYRTLWIHDYLRPGGAVEGIERVLARGWASHAGFISRGDDARSVDTLLGTGLFKLVNLPFSLLNPTPSATGYGQRGFRPDHHGLIRRAEAAGTGIAVYSPLAGGLLTDSLLESGKTHPISRAKDTAALEASGKLDLARRFQVLAREAGMPLSRLAYRFVLSFSGVTTLLGGLSAIDHLEDAVAASAQGGLDAGLMAEIGAIWDRPAARRAGS